MEKRGKPFNTFEPDELDMRLVTELEMDARQSAYTLAAKLSLNPSTVARRMQKLINAKAITIIAVPNPVALGYKTAVLIGLNIRPGKSLEAAKHIMSLKNVGSLGFHYLSMCTGRYDILYFTAFRTPVDLLRFVDEELTETPDLTDIHVLPALRAVKNSWTHVGSDTGVSLELLDYDLDQSEIDLINQLMCSPRESPTSLASKVGMSRLVATKRLQMLLDRRVVRVVCIADPVIFGYHVSAGIMVKVLPGHKIGVVAKALASYTRIQKVTIIAGLFDLFLHCKFHDIKEMNNFLVDELGNVPGIMRHETLLELGLPDNPFCIV
ncbi:MAG: Lrp/AsnC family transcriptional regulator [Dehalococcoidia bacterium]